MCGVTKLDKIRNEIKGVTTKVEKGSSLKEVGHVMRREEHYVGRTAMDMKVGLQ